MASPTLQDYDSKRPSVDGQKLSGVELRDTELSPENVSVEENSIYPEVQASVPARDQDVPANTVRVWVLGIVTTLVQSGFTQLFALHNPPLSLSSYVVILLVYPVGKLLGRYVPRCKWHVLGWKLDLNPGPFNVKEHTVIAIMAIGSSGFDSGGLATYVWTAMEKILDLPVSTGFRLLFLLTTQGLAFGLAGIFQKLVVDPAYCIWPTALPTCTLIHSLHNGNFLQHVESRWKISPLRFFWLAICAVTLWHLLPFFLFTGISYFAWVTWIYPDNITINQLFGAYSGMDLLPMTLDWNQITAYLASPLVTPLWAILNIFGGAVLFLWVISPALHWSNVWYGMYFPFSSSSIFDNTGNSYNTSRVLTSDYAFNSTAYHEYSPIFLSTTSAISYGLGFGAVSSVLVHAALYYRGEIWLGLRKTFSRQTLSSSDEDIHTKLMKKYKPTPTWWYLASLVFATVLSIVFVECFGTGLPWWGVILSLAINLVIFIPVAILSALCNQSVSTNVVSALIGGYLWEGNMVAVVVFKCISFNALGSSMYLARDQKLGHYMKIPPRVVFCAQALGIIVNWLTQTGVNIWAMNNIAGVCTGDAKGQFECPVSSAMGSSMVFWGLIGPSRLFSNGAMYQPMLWFFLVGAALPVFLYYADKKFPRLGLHYINIPVIMSSIAAVPPATASNYLAWGFIGIIFQWYLRSRAFGWWKRYNFLLSAALDGGLAITSLFVFLAFTYPGVTLSWWGNSIDSTTADYSGLPLLTVTNSTFGPNNWL